MCGTLYDSNVCSILHSFWTDNLLAFQLTFIAIVSPLKSLLCISFVELSLLNENTAPLPPLCK